MMSDVLSVPCPACRAPAGAKCKNYRGVNKQTCQARIAPPKQAQEPKEPPSQPDLFGHLEDATDVE